MARDPLLWLCAEMRVMAKRIAVVEASRPAATPRYLCLDELVPTQLHDGRLFPLRPPGVFFFSNDVQSPNNILQFSMENKQFDDGEKYEYGSVETHVVADQSAEMTDNDDAHSPNVADFSFHKSVYGDVEAHAFDADTSDFSLHQFIAPDEACDPIGSDDNEQDAASNDAARSKNLSVEVFDRDNVPSPDIFVQISEKTKYMPYDVGKQNEQDAVSNDAARPKILSMPHDDDGEQYEYGDVEIYAIEFSPQFEFGELCNKLRRLRMMKYVFRAANNDAARSKTLFAEVSETHAIDADAAKFIDEKYKHGDVETHAIDADTLGSSPHRFIDQGDNDNEQEAASNDAVPKALDPLHVKLLIKIAKNISAETVHATVTAVATKLLEHIDNRMNDVDVRMKDLKEFTQQTRHIQHATFCRRFGDDY